MRVLADSWNLCPVNRYFKVKLMAGARRSRGEKRDHLFPMLEVKETSAMTHAQKVPAGVRDARPQPTPPTSQRPVSAKRCCVHTGGRVLSLAKGGLKPRPSKTMGQRKPEGRPHARDGNHLQSTGSFPSVCLSLLAPAQPAYASLLINTLFASLPSVSLPIFFSRGTRTGDLYQVCWPWGV